MKPRRSYSHWFLQGENKALEIAVQAQKKQLMEKQQLELQKQQVQAILEREIQ
jgi:hypothetical protein